MLANGIRLLPDGGSGSASPARGGRPAIAEWMFPGLLVAKATARLGDVDGMCQVIAIARARATGLGEMAGCASRLRRT